MTLPSSVLPIVLPRDDGVHSEDRSDGVTPSSRWPSKGGGIRAASQAFLQAFPNLGCFCPSFSKQIFGRFVGFQEVASLPNRKCGLSKSFVVRRPLSASFWPRPTTFRRLAPQRSERGPRLAWAYGEVGQGVRSWRSSDPDRENFEPSTHSVLWKEKSAPGSGPRRARRRSGRVGDGQEGRSGPSGEHDAGTTRRNCEEGGSFYVEGSLGEGMRTFWG